MHFKGNLRLLGGKKIQSPKGLKTRPTTSIVREAIINKLGDKIYNSTWLDLFSGSGVIGCEAIQKGAKRILAIEINKQTAKVCKDNLYNISSQLNLEVQIDVLCRDVVKTLKKGVIKSSSNYIKKNVSDDFAFDFIFIDPPYKFKIYSTILENLLLGDWLKQRSIVICEHAANDSLNINNDWSIIDTRKYGKSELLFLTPNLA